MPLTSTPPMPVSKVISTGSSSAKLTFILSPPYQSPLFIATIIITQSSGEHFSSSLTPGIDKQHGGKLYLYVDAATFAVLQCQAVVPFKVVLSYDTTTDEVVQIDVVRDVAAVNQDLIAAMAAALRQAMPNEGAQALLAEGEGPRRSHPSAE